MKRITLFFIICLFSGVFGDEVKSVSVMEGDSVTLHTDTEIQKADATLTWTFWAQTIARINRAVKIFSVNDDVLDGRFRDRLQMNNQTGDLTITNITTEDSGLYEVDINVGNDIIQKSFDVKGVVGAGEVKSVSVMDGDSVTLHTDVPDIKKYVEIRWRFEHENSPLAEVNKNISIFPTYNNVLDGRFKNKLQLDVQTGSLNIRNIRTKHSGLYKVDLTSSSSSGSYTIHQSFTITLSDKVKSVSVMEGDSVTLYTDLTEIQRDDKIDWMFVPDDSLIAQILQLSKWYDDDDGKFRGRLKLNDHTGDLTISDSKTEVTGLYEAKMSIRRRSIQRRFIVTVTERGLSSGAIAGISVFILLLAAAAAAAGVIYYRRMIAEASKQLVTTLKRNEGESVDLKTEVTDIQRVNLIEWRFGDKETLIAEINPASDIFSTYDGDDDLFRDKLKLNHQTGDLNINDIRQKHNGVYKLRIIRDGKTSYRRFIVFVRGETLMEVFEGASVDLKTKVTDIQKDDVIEWRFGVKETLIAEINPANNILRTYDGDYGEFRAKLKLNPQTGDLTIKNFRKKNDGVYKLKIIRNGETSYNRFRVVTGTIEELLVDEGESVNLKTEVKEIHGVKKIEWRFGKTLIAKINRVNNISSTFDGDDDLFRGKLKLNDQTGDLNINDLREKHTGVYLLKIIREGETTYRRFRVFVRFTKVELLENEGASVNLKTEVTDIKRVDVIEWRFGNKETLIAEINPNKSPNTYDGDDDDDLFRDKLKLNPQTGDLNINDIRKKHDGVYLLKIIRDGKTSYKSFRVYVGCTTEKLDLNEGETFHLKTEVTDLQRDDVIEWRFEETLIAKINPANKIFSTYDGDYDEFKDKLKLNHQTGDLTISDIRGKHEGVYKLKIIRNGKTLYKRFRVAVRAGEDSVRIVMRPLLPNSSQ